MKLGIIYARSRNGVIGKDGVMPWHLPEDLAHLKAKTMGTPVIMGRKTWDSLPPRFRPLPGRRNIVVTRNELWHADGGERVASLEEAVALCAGTPMAWVIGGAEIYRLAMPLADIAEVTEIDADFDGNTYMPELGSGWQETSRERHVSANGIAYSFTTYHNTHRGD